MIILKTKGNFYAEGEIVLNLLKTIHWKDLNDKNPPHLPNGSNIELLISFDENEFLLGKDGIVWASFEARQVEIIQNTLIAQQISCEIKKINLQNQNMFLISITNKKDIQDAIDFIYKSDYGLRLKPDWNYAEGEANKSFEQWLNEH